LASDEDDGDDDESKEVISGGGSGDRLHFTTLTMMICGDADQQREL
jgi:hypothetical protein